jgi:hypothetical protein
MGRPEGAAGKGVGRWLPSFSVSERHERLVDLPAEEAIEAVLRSPVAPDPIVRTLFLLRGFGASDESVESFASRHGFVVLERTPTTFVFGLATRFRGRPRRAGDPESWRSWSPPGLKIAADFRAVPVGEDRSRLSTETRVLPLDGTSRLLFRAYWLVVGPFSALIRRRWLRAIAARTRS